MGLQSLLKKLKIQEKEVRVLVLGLESSGKTTLSRAFSGESLDSEISPTDGFLIHKMERDGLKINFWDVGGSPHSRTFWRNYFDSTDVVIWAVDSSSEETVDESRKELETVLSSDRLTNASLIVVATKQDVSGSMTLQQVLDRLQVNNGSVGERNWTAFPFTPEDREKCLTWIVNDFTQRLLNQ